MFPADVIKKRRLLDFTVSCYSVQLFDAHIGYEARKTETDFANTSIAVVVSQRVALK
jgi:hypothetical protein